MISPFKSALPPGASEGPYGLTRENIDRIGRVVKFVEQLMRGGGGGAGRVDTTSIPGWLAVMSSSVGPATLGSGSTPTTPIAGTAVLCTGTIAAPTAGTVSVPVYNGLDKTITSGATVGLSWVQGGWLIVWVDSCTRLS